MFGQSYATFNEIADLMKIMKYNKERNGYHVLNTVCLLAKFLDTSCTRICQLLPTLPCMSIKKDSFSQSQHS